MTSSGSAVEFLDSLESRGVGGTSCLPGQAPCQVSEIHDLESKMSEEQALHAMAARLEMTFALILKGESHGDRVPGVPRVIKASGSAPRVGSG